MPTDKVLGDGACALNSLTTKQLIDVETTWDDERYGGGPDAPLLVAQQYVLFDEHEAWPYGDGWP
jgi:hypothetical protein